MLMRELIEKINEDLKVINNTTKTSAHEFKELFEEIIEKHILPYGMQYEFFSTRMKDLRLRDIFLIEMCLDWDENVCDHRKGISKLKSASCCLQHKEFEDIDVSEFTEYLNKNLKKYIN